MNHLKTLFNLWFHPPTGCTHADKLENFYAKQVNDYDAFRKNLLWAREDMLKACAVRLEKQTNLVWIDLGGGTGENVEMMSKYMDLSKFSKIYILDLCHSMCEKAKERVARLKWTNVEVIEADACKKFLNKAHLVTFSYSLSMMPNYLTVIDTVKEYLHPNGIVAVCDFGVKHKYEMSWYRRFFWKSIFDIDNIQLGPERKDYLKHCFETIWEYEGAGSIPFVPYLKAPYYIWLGGFTQPPLSITFKDHGVKMNHPSFLYHMSWEDPKEDEKYMDWNSKDKVLSLVSGGCNLFELLLHDVKEVVGVDINVAQIALVELKMLCFLLLPYDTTWQMFGEGIYPEIDKLYNNLLKYHLTYQSNVFWSTRLHYFKTELYNYGGMGTLSKYIRKYIVPTNIVDCTTVAEQYQRWCNIPVVKIYKNNRSLFKRVIESIISNKYFSWYGLGVPANQLNMLEGSVFDYIYKTLDPIMQKTLLVNNYFYYNIFTGKFSKTCCPDYLKEENYEWIKERLHRIKLVNSTFLAELHNGSYSKVILMDHMDWMDEKYARTMKEALTKHNARIQWRSAAKEPFYKSIIMEGHDFEEVVHIVRGEPANIIDQVNMYAHYYVMDK